MVTATLQDVAIALPEQVLTNDALATEFPEWSVEKITRKTGIHERHIAIDTFSSDLATAAAEQLFSKYPQLRQEVDFILLCTQTPDYLLPTTACLVQDRLDLPTTVGALDINLGCSGYVYSLGLAKALVESNQATNVLLLTADTYTHLLDSEDKSCRTIFGDGASATWIQASEVDDANQSIGPFVYGTDGRGAKNLIANGSGLKRSSQEAQICPGHLYMNGPEIYTFTLKAVPRLIQAALSKADHTIDDVDHFVFHQANQYMLESLRRKCKIPESKFPIHLGSLGNTVSSTIPITLHAMLGENRVRSGQRLMLVGFGVGYSWGATFVTVP